MLRCLHRSILSRLGASGKHGAVHYEFCDYIEDDVVTDIPIRLKVALTIGDGRIHLDFTGSDVQVGSALNVSTAGRVHSFMAVALMNYFVTRDRTIPLMPAC